MMKALSVRQPWASMIVSGEKTIETRGWSTYYRGDLLICSTKQPIFPMQPSGYALAIAELIDCRPMIQNDELLACCKIYPGAYSWILKNIRLIKQFPVKGRLGLFDVDLPE